MSEQINDRILSVIKELTLNPNSFAESIGVSGTVVHNIVSGRRTKPSYDLLVKIFKTYSDLNATWLLKGEGKHWIEESKARRQKQWDLEPRILVVMQELMIKYASDSSVTELSGLMKSLLKENNFNSKKAERLLVKNEKLLAVLREKLDLDV